MIDVHNFRFQLNDGGVSTSTTGSRSSAPSCPRPMTREYESLFFHRFSLSSFFFASFSSHVTRSLSPSLHLLAIATPFFVVLLFFAFAFCTFPTDHYFLFVTLYDELVQVRCSRREVFTGSPFFAPSTLLSFAFPPLSRWLLTAARSSFLYFSFVSRSPSAAQSATLSRFRMSFNSVNERKCEGRMTPRTRNTRRRD